MLPRSRSIGSQQASVPWNALPMGLEGTDRYPSRHIPIADSKITAHFSHPPDLAAAVPE